MIKIGVIGLDSSHPVSLARILHAADEEYHVPGARITAAYAGGSADLEMSRKRLQQFTPTLVDKEGVKLMSSPQDVARSCDAMIISAMDARQHWPLFKAIAPFRKPVFIDKPIAMTRAEAEQIFELADLHQTPVMSCSARRFDPQLIELVGKHRGSIVGVDSYVPLKVVEPMEGLLWYGIHGVEAMFTALGSGCRSLRSYRTDSSEHYLAEWNGGKTGSLRLYTHRSLDAGMVLHTLDGSFHIDFIHARYPVLWGLAQQLVDFFACGVSPVEEKETLEIMAFIEAANGCRKTGNGSMVKLQ